MVIKRVSFGLAVRVRRLERLERTWCHRGRLLTFLKVSLQMLLAGFNLGECIFVLLEQFIEHAK